MPPREGVRNERTPPPGQFRVLSVAPRIVVSREAELWRGIVSVRRFRVVQGDVGG